MSGIFNSENKVFSTLSKVFDMIVIGLVWILLCIPIITIGPATTALYYTIVKVIRRERSYLFKEFWRSFKLNFKQGIVVSIIFVVFAFIMYVDFRFLNEAVEESYKYRSVLYGVYLVVIVMAVFLFLYVFPILSRFTVSTKQLFKWAFLLSVRHFVSTFLMTAILAVFIVLSYLVIYTLIGAPLLLIAPSLCVLLISLPMERILKKYMPKTEPTTDPDGEAVDQWYNE